MWILTNGKHVQARIIEWRASSDIQAYVWLECATFTPDDESTSISQRNWVLRPPGVDDVEHLHVVVHPNDPCHVKLKTALVQDTIVLTVFLVGLLGFIGFFVDMNFWILTGIQLSSGGEISLIIFLAPLLQIRIFGYFLVHTWSKLVCASYMQMRQENNNQPHTSLLSPTDDDGERIHYDDGGDHTAVRPEIDDDNAAQHKFL
jgi:hypothetical protein